MKQNKRDTELAQQACEVIIDGRTYSDAASIMVTLDHVIATLLLVLYRDSAKANSMFHEGTIPGVEERFSLFLARTLQGDEK